MPETKKKLNIKLEMLGGFSAGVIGTVIGYPLDLVKTRMQTGSHQLGFVRVGTGIMQKEGFLALYRGMAPSLISLAILNTTNFASYNYFRSIFGAERGWDVNNLFAGAMGAPFGSTISTVEHMIKTQMQLDNIGDKRFRGSLHCLTTLVEERGWKIIYTGHVVNTVREGIFLGTYFYTYEGLRQLLQSVTSQGYEKKSNNSAWTIPVAGGISGAWAWFVSFPLDCIKATIQGSRLQPEVSCNGEIVASRKMKSVDVLKDLLRAKGLRGLYAGVTPSIARAFIVSGTRFSAYEFTLKIFGDYFR